MLAIHFSFLSLSLFYPTALSPPPHSSLSSLSPLSPSPSPLCSLLPLSLLLPPFTSLPFDLSHLSPPSLSHLLSYLTSLPFSLSSALPLYPPSHLTLFPPSHLSPLLPLSSHLSLSLPVLVIIGCVNVSIILEVMPTGAKRS